MEFPYDDEGLQTTTSTTQQECEETCFSCLQDNLKSHHHLFRDMHADFCRKGLERLPRGFVSLDASRPWLCYWMLHSLCLLAELPGTALLDRVVNTLKRYQNPQTGGFGGGSHQLSHCAPTYSACLALLTVGTTEAYGIIDRKKMYKFFLSMKAPCGGFRMHDDGEIDVRATYTVLAVSSLLNIMTPELTKGTAEWVCSCQTYEGGFGGEPFNEAHGGYAFCGFAALLILGKTDMADTRGLLKWICRRQMIQEGGFQGRTNKLVDACYSFWQGSIPAMLALATDFKFSAKEMQKEETAKLEDAQILGDLLTDQVALQEYLLLCCQQRDGGLKDKPGKYRDHYHTCYALSGLSIAQNFGKPVVFEGDEANRLLPSHPIYNIREDKLNQAKEHFQALPSDHRSLVS